MDDRKRSGYIGECGTIGYHYEDHRPEVKIKHPVGVAVSEDSVFVSLQADWRVLSMDKETEVCMLRVELLLSVGYLAHEPVLNFLYIGLANGVAFKMLDNDSKTGTILVDRNGGGIGSFASTGFKSVFDIVVLDVEHLIVSDSGNNR